MNIEFYGYLQDKETEQPLQLREVTLVAESEDLRTIAQFLNYVANLIEKYGDDFGHEHLADFTRDIKAEPSFVVVASTKR